MAVAESGFKGFLYPPIFAGMKCENGDASAGIEAGREIAQKGFERGELIVHGDAERLENAAHGEFALIVLISRQRGANGIGQRARGLECFSGKRRRQSWIRFISVLEQQARELLRGQFLQENGSGLSRAADSSA